MRIERRSNQELLKELADMRRKVEELQVSRRAREVTQNAEATEAERYLDIAGVMIVAIGADKKVTLVNREGCSILGRERDDIVGKDWFSHFIPKRLRKTVGLVFDQVMKGDAEAVECFENPVLLPDGSERLITWHNTVLRDAEGQITGTLSSGSDITKQEETRALLKLAAERWKTTFNAMASSVVVLNPDRRIIECNTATVDFFGKPIENVVGVHCCEVMHGKTEPIENCPFQRMLLSKHSEHLVTRIGKAWLDILVEPILDESGVLKGAVHVVADITEQKETEQRFRVIFDNATDGILLADMDTRRFVMGNRAMGEMLGYASEELHALSVEDIHPEESLPYVSDQFAKQAKGRIRLAANIPMKRKDGSVVYADVNSAPVQIQGKTYLMGIFRDVTERRDLERQIRESEREYRSLVDNAVVGVFKTTLDGRILFINDAMARMLGADSKEVLIGENVGDSYSNPDDRKALVEVLQRDGTVERFTVELLTKQGKPRTFQLGAHLAGDHIAGVAIDVTEQKMAEERVEALSRFPNENPHPVLRIAGNGAVLYGNKASASLLDAWGCRKRKVMPEVWCRRIRDVLATGQARQEEAACGGTLYSLVLSPVVERHYVNIYGMDITERKRAENALADSNKQLQDALDRLQHAQDQVIRNERLSALGEMASGIAHDFNNVLMPISGLSDLLLKDPEMLRDSEEVKSSLEGIRGAARDAREIVRRLREFYRPSEKLAKVPVAVSDIVNEVISLTRPKWEVQAQAEGRQIAIVTDFAEISDIMANPFRLREVLMNLIFNAVDAMPEGGEVGFKTYEEERHVVVQVCDTGVGMSEETKMRCQEPFFTTKEAHGSGLGLSMCHGIITRHKGNLEIESEVGRGTTVTIRLPVGHAETNEVEEEETAESLAARRELHVLIIDDEKWPRVLLQRYLHFLGHRSETAESGKQGLAKFEAGNFDLVMVDRAMPEMNGDEVAQRVKKVSPMTPVILVTGLGDMMDFAGECPAGVDAVVSKPIDATDLNATIEKVMGIGELRNGERGTRYDEESFQA